MCWSCSPVWEVFQHFAPLLYIQTCVDLPRQQATAAYLNRQGGVRSAQLLNAARRLLFWARTHVALHQSNVYSRRFEQRCSQSAAAVLCEEYGDSDLCHAHWRVTRTGASVEFGFGVTRTKQSPFEPLDQVPLKLLSAKVGYYCWL